MHFQIEISSLDKEVLQRFQHGFLVRLGDNRDQKVEQQNREKDHIDEPKEPDEIDHELGIWLAVLFHLSPVIVRWSS